MADSYSSAGVYSTETDLSQPTLPRASGVPAGVIGTAETGPAFVPITLKDYQSYVNVFGGAAIDPGVLGRTSPTLFGPLAVYSYLQNAQALTYLRVLGVGDGKQRNANTGKVTSAGFTVGSNQVQENGLLGANRNAVALGEAGRTYFLGCFLSESNGSRILQEAGIAEAASDRAFPIIRGVLLAASGVIPKLSGSLGMPAGKSSAPDITVAARNGTDLKGAATGSVHTADGKFVMLLNGMKDSEKNVITASFDLKNPSYFAKVLNKDASKIEKYGHVLYSWFDVEPGFADITGSGVFSPRLENGRGAKIGFLLSGSQARDTAVASISPNYESFEDRFTHPKTPFFISQGFGGTIHNLFRIHARGDGAATSEMYKISIRNITPALEAASYKYGTFDVLVRDFKDNDASMSPLEQFLGCNLDPSSENYIARKIGDRHTYFDFDQAEGSQKLVTKGDHLGNSTRIRVEVNNQIELGNIPDEALPFGFRGPDHLVTSGSGPLNSTGLAGGGPGGVALTMESEIYNNAVVLPIRYRKDIKVGPGAPDLESNPSLFWGVQFERRVPQNLVTDVFGNRELRSLNTGQADKDASMRTRTKFFPQFTPGQFNFSVGNNNGTADVNGTVLDCDRFNNNIFTLERLSVKTGSSGDVADPESWVSASYVRDGNITVGHGLRALTVNDLRTQGNRTYAKYTVFMQGGFDGTNIFNIDKADMTTNAAKREVDDSTRQGGIKGATVASYRKAIDIMGVKSDVNIKLLAVPGIRNASVTDYALDTVEERFDALFIMDIEQRDKFNNVMTASKDPNGLAIIPNVTYTASGFAGRALDSSFGAAYFPDAVMDIKDGKGRKLVPPSVAVMGAIAKGDNISGKPYLAPAGFTRASLGEEVDGLQANLEREDLDKLYQDRINPIVTFAGQRPTVWGQKTLQADASALDRINVRRLLIFIRRQVKAVANSLLFEPNREETLERFNALVKPIMQSVQDGGGVSRYKVIIDTTTTTQSDVENNTIRGKIYLQPTRTAEFIALDFTVANASNFDSV